MDGPTIFPAQPGQKFHGGQRVQVKMETHSVHDQFYAGNIGKVLGYSESNFVVVAMKEGQTPLLEENSLESI
jgi:ribosomal protein L21E